MAAETSTDAQVPVAFALAKLGVLFSLEYVKEVRITLYNAVISDKIFIKGHPIQSL